MMNAPVFSFWKITWNWWCWLQPGADVTPKYMHVSFICRFVLNDIFWSFDDWISIFLVFVLLLINGIPLGVNSPFIRYHAYLESSNTPPEVCSICFQLLAAVCRLSHFFLNFFFQSYVHCHLSSTNPMIWSF